jgi:hypothetical protein
MSQIDQIITPISIALKGCANELLDIRDAATSLRQPGTCVACYYKVMGRARRSHRLDSLAALKQWIEAHVEVIAEAEANQVLERFPVALDNECDLESYCTTMMDKVQNDRNFEADIVHLRFEFIEKAL